MARVPYVDRDDVAEEYRPIYEQLIAQRGLPVHNLFRVLANTPPIMEKYLGLSNQLRFKTRLDGELRELAILAVGQTAQANYEYTQHWNVARRMGIAREKLEQLGNFESSALFTPEQKAVMRYATGVTRDIRVDDATVVEVRKFLPLWEFMELVQIVAFYNMVVRILEPLEVELEPGTVKQ